MPELDHGNHRLQSQENIIQLVWPAFKVIMPHLHHWVRGHRALHVTQMLQFLVNFLS